LLLKPLLACIPDLRQRWHPSLLSFWDLASRRTTALRIAEYQKQLEDHDRDAAQELDQLTTALLKKLKTREPRASRRRCSSGLPTASGSPGC
jgi:hypothetical protein